jgi:hypothetical protein
LLRVVAQAIAEERTLEALLETLKAEAAGLD